MGKEQELNEYLADLIGVNRFRDNWDPLDDLNQTFKVIRKVLEDTERSWSHGEYKKFCTRIPPLTEEEPIPENEFNGRHDDQRKSIIEAVLRYQGHYDKFKEVFE